MELSDVEVVVGEAAVRRERGARQLSGAPPGHGRGLLARAAQEFAQADVVDAEPIGSVRAGRLGQDHGPLPETVDETMALVRRCDPLPFSSRSRAPALTARAMAPGVFDGLHARLDAGGPDDDRHIGLFLAVAAATSTGPLWRWSIRCCSPGRWRRRSGCRRPVPRLLPGTLRALAAVDWPGNVRELERLGIVRSTLYRKMRALGLDENYLPTAAAPRWRRCPNVGHPGASAPAA
ncbi:hypothetical protein [Pseudonocardia humida]|uniref:Regulatory Fis family protein n=1 Tax=Pseudonocardia humida TaxID=2800819 RepID=A0ABT1A230_9PSEU|nr:hypothetical protein [Pseudonocardia humida]MCO1657061.1 hypothetical protein [Pseudonocardia humida]